MPMFSNHAWRRLGERGISFTALHQALGSDAVPGTTFETVIYRGGGVTVVVNARTGLIITLW
jgi:hypothetical protein